ncbi:uncharacterized protein LOC120696004 [Panicum virgatum]|uniref:uncharacterized protein LOC120696004 n=1 Tax=Panicum virgatum TaxID=38727 RepID=UPI0019D61CF4|nr:uncharacterized protein LOC120696004 [Panicum virgatum]
MTETPGTWSWGASDKEKKRFACYFRALQQLREAGLNRCSVVSAYHKRRIAPLMARTLPLYRMVEGTDLSGTVMSSEGIDKAEVLRPLKETFDPPVAYPDPQPPTMLPDEGALALDRSDFYSSAASLPEDAVSHERNCLATEANLAE